MLCGQHNGGSQKMMNEEKGIESTTDNNKPDWPKPKIGGGLRHKFSKQEDETLRRIVMQHGEGNWGTIAACMKNRTARQCRERYKNYLSPRIKNEPWTQEEEQLLERKFAELGPKWAKIALFFESRSDVNVKNHWAAMVNRQHREKIMKQEKNDLFGRQGSVTSNGMVSLIPVYQNNPQMIGMQPSVYQQLPIQQVQSITVTYPQQYGNYPVYQVPAMYSTQTIQYMQIPNKMIPQNSVAQVNIEKSLPDSKEPSLDKSDKEEASCQATCDPSTDYPKNEDFHAECNKNYNDFETSIDNSFEYDTTFDASFDLFDAF